MDSNTGEVKPDLRLSKDMQVRIVDSHDSCTIRWDEHGSGFVVRATNTWFLPPTTVERFVPLTND